MINLDERLTIKSLYELAAQIQELRNDTEYSLIEFYSYSPKPVEMAANLALPIISVQTQYTLLGPVVKFSVMCKKLGIQDLDSNDIYEASNGILFVFTGLDIDKPKPLYSGIYFYTPRLKLEKQRDISTRFMEASESITKSIYNKYFPGKEDSFESDRLQLANQLRELQEIAYMQGKGLNATDIHQ